MNHAKIMYALSGMQLEELAESLSAFGLKLSRQTMYNRTRQATNAKPLLDTKQKDEFKHMMLAPNEQFQEMSDNFKAAYEMLGEIFEDNLDSSLIEDDDVDFDDIGIDDDELNLDENLLDDDDMEMSEQSDDLSLDDDLSIADNDDTDDDISIEDELDIEDEVDDALDDELSLDDELDLTLDDEDDLGDLFGEDSTDQPEDEVDELEKLLGIDKLEKLLSDDDLAIDEDDELDIGV